MSHGKYGALGLCLSALVACAPLRSVIKAIDMTPEQCTKLVEALGGEDSAEVALACVTATSIDDLIAAKKQAQARRLATAKDAGAGEQ